MQKYLKRDFLLHAFPFHFQLKLIWNKLMVLWIRILTSHSNSRLSIRIRLGVSACVVGRGDPNNRPLLPSLVVGTQTTQLAQKKITTWKKHLPCGSHMPYTWVYGPTWGPYCPHMPSELPQITTWVPSIPHVGIFKIISPRLPHLHPTWDPYGNIMAISIQELPIYFHVGDIWDPCG